MDEPVSVYNFTVEDYLTYYVTDIGVWVHNTQCSFTKAWIQRSTFNMIKKELGKDAAQKFANSAKKGCVNSGSGTNGIKYLKGPGVNGYKYEINIAGKYGNARAYGNLDKKTGHIIFSSFSKDH